MRRPKQNGLGGSLLRGNVYSHCVEQPDALKGKPEISLLVRNCQASSSGVPNSIGSGTKNAKHPAGHMVFGT